MNGVRHFFTRICPDFPIFVPMEIALTWGNFYRHPRFWRHLGVWAFFIVLMGINIYVSFRYNPDSGMHDGLDDLVFFLVEMVVLIYASFYAYNRLIPQQKFIPFALLILLITLGVAVVDDWLATSAVQIGALTGFLANLVLFPFILLSAFGFKLAYHGVRQVFIIERLRARQTESELRLLRSQINPHFLFNTLNNIYSTNLEDHDKANDIILELADILRYQLESNKKPRTPLSDEINSLENYLSLERIRVRDCHVHLEKQGDFEAVEIVPLLLLPFIENAFKYGTGLEPGEIALRFELTEGHQFHFHCRNKIVRKKEPVHSGGIGLENVKKRLALAYPGRYRLQVQPSTHYFTVDLNITL